jgi:hypothetical protein
MSNKEQIPLTASELGYLWTGYSINEMSKWFLTTFAEHTKDEEMKSLFEMALKSNAGIVEGRGELLRQAEYPVPIGFSKSDIDVDSPALFSESFMLYYLHVGIRLGLEFHSRSLALMAREDIRKICGTSLRSTIELNEEIVKVLLEKGLFRRTPHLPEPTAAEYIQKTSYLNGWFGDHRPINSMELANLYHILDLLLIMETLSLGFAQSTDSEDVSEILNKAVDVIRSQFQALAELLDNEKLPIPPSYVAEITNSNQRVFSDRIMVTHITGLFGSLLSQYGFALGAVMKNNLVAIYTAQISKAGSYCEKITQFLIDKKWLEKVPGATPRGEG